MILILGSSGYIGYRLFCKLKEESLYVVGTYHQNKKNGMLFFDIGNMQIEDIKVDIKKIQYVIISAAAHATIDESRKQWIRAYDINVTRMKEIIKYFLQNDIVPIYLSTDNVFDGKKGNYTETDERNPINCYGRMRYEVENYLMETTSSFIILRMGKVFGSEMGDNTLITSIIKDLKDGEKVFCADDQIFTPVYIEDLVKFIKIIVEHKFSGVYHLASIEAMSRYEIALAIQKYFNLSKSNLIPCKIDSLGLIEKRPKLIDLNISRYKELSDFREKPIDYYLSLIR